MSKFTFTYSSCGHLIDIFLLYALAISQLLVVDSDSDSDSVSVCAFSISLVSAMSHYFVAFVWGFNQEVFNCVVRFNWQLTITISTSFHPFLLPTAPFRTPFGAIIVWRHLIELFRTTTVILKKREKSSRNQKDFTA